LGASISAGASDEGEATIAIGGGEGSADVVLEEGSLVGRYVVIERVGAGAMGLVVRAYDPKLKREVALKLIRRGRGGSEARARLLREAQALARLAHPNVVAVYDAEDTRHGVAIAMEYAPGGTLRDWLAARPRSWREVLPVVLSAAAGIAAAHRAGLVHRDIKPDNILVAGDGRVRVTDFGLARGEPAVTSRDPFGMTLDGDEALTLEGSIMGTPGYMAPEQHARAPTDARSDQYALCIVLWEAIHGTRPFSGRDLDELGAAKRAGPPRAAPTRAIPGWLHATLVKGLSADPEQRWPSIEALQEALTSGASRQRRNRSVLALAGVLTFASTAVLWSQLDHRAHLAACADAARSIHVDVWDDGARDALRRGLLSTRASHAVTTHDKVVTMIDAYASKWQSLRGETCVAEVEGRLETEIAHRSAQCFEEHGDGLRALIDVLAESSESDGDVVRRAVIAVARLPRIEECADHVTLAARPLPPPDPTLRVRGTALRKQMQRARGLDAAGRHEEAFSLAAEVVTEAGSAGLVTLELEAEHLAGGHAQRADRLEEGARRLRRALVEAGRIGLDEVAADAALGLVWTVGRKLARREEGLAYADLAAVLVERLGDHDGGLRRATLASNVASIRLAHGEYDEAERLYARALELDERILGRDHIQLASSYNNLAGVAFARGAYDEAERLLRRSAEIREAALGPDHPDVALALINLGSVNYRRGAYDEAEAMFVRTLEVREAISGPNDAGVADALVNLGAVHLVRHKYEDALRAFERALEIHEAVQGPDHPQVAMVLGNLATTHRTMGALHEAEKAHRRALAIDEQVFGAEHHTVATQVGNLGDLLRERGEYEEAEVMLRRSLEIYERTLGPDHEAVAHPLVALGDLALDQDRPHAAIEPLERALAVREHLDVGGVRAKLARALWDSGEDRARALEVARRGLEDHRTVGEPRREEAEALEAWIAERETLVVR
jgi:eukaryotic-like serine/threonine-protein kinase